MWPTRRAPGGALSSWNFQLRSQVAKELEARLRVIERWSRSSAQDDHRPLAALGLHRGRSAIDTEMAEHRSLNDADGVSLISQQGPRRTRFGRTRKLGDDFKHVGAKAVPVFSRCSFDGPRV